ncbi:hypothetical protein NEOLEDRAFT_1143362, partial [Neolentinus lepideus HHB14362 ss-1]
ATCRVEYVSKHGPEPRWSSKERQCSLFRWGSLWEGEPAFKLMGEAEIQVKEARASFKLGGR